MLEGVVGKMMWSEKEKKQDTESAQTKQFWVMNKIY